MVEYDYDKLDAKFATKEVVGNRIRHYREDVMKMTQEELSGQIGCSDTTVRNFENGRSYPKQEFLKRLAALFSAAGRIDTDDRQGTVKPLHKRGKYSPVFFVVLSLQRIFIAIGR